LIAGALKWPDQWQAGGHSALNDSSKLYAILVLIEMGQTLQ